MTRFDVLAKSATACAVALVMAGCGGGGNDTPSASASTSTSTSTNPPAAAGTTRPDPSLKLSGNAATGAALASATVAVKCATGTGSATTDTNGAYTLKLEGGALPCMIKVTGTQGGVEVTLHSLAEAGTTDAGSATTSAAANATPLTEMIVAQLSGGLPTDLFESFGAGTGGQLTTEKLVAATNAVLTALKEATGIDLGSIDPFKAQLVAAASGAPDSGNAYDKLLDILGEKVALESLPQVVNQIAAASASGSSGSLGEVMTSVDQGYLPGCPVMVSGKYRLVDFFGRTNVRQIDFKAMTLSAIDGPYVITADPAKACEFTAADAAGTQARFTFVMGASGLGSYRTENLVSGKTSIGYIFPQQSHTAAEFTGEWRMLHSGAFPDSTPIVFEHIVGKLNFKADGIAAVCDYDYATLGTCSPDTEANLSFVSRDDGGITLNSGGAQAAVVYGYRAPSGSFNVFGTTNPDGANTPQTEQTHFVLTKPQATVPPAVGYTVKYWDVSFNQPSNGQPRITSVTSDINTTTAVNGDIETKTRTSDGRVTDVRHNYPLNGMRYRAAGTASSIYQFPIPGTGISLSINSAQTSQTQGHVYVISVNK